MPTFDESDHRAHRRAEWLREAIQKVDRVRFLQLEDTRTMGQSAIQFVLKKPEIVSVLPNFTNMDELKEYTAAVDTPAITDAEQEYLDELWDNAFYLADVEREFREVSSAPPKPFYPTGSGVEPAPESGIIR